MSGTASGTMPKDSGRSEDGFVVDGGFSGTEEIEHGENDEEDSTGDLEVGHLNAQKVEDRLAEENEQDTGGACGKGGPTGDVAALLIGVWHGQADIDGERAGNIHNHEERDEDQEEVVKSAHEGLDFFYERGRVARSLLRILSPNDHE